MLKIILASLIQAKVVIPTLFEFAENKIKPQVYTMLELWSRKKQWHSSKISENNTAIPTAKPFNPYKETSLGLDKVQVMEINPVSRWRLLH